MKSTFKDLTNCRFGRLVVLYLDKETIYSKHKKWICKCDCGNEKSIRSDALIGNKTISCGCLAKEKSSKRMYEYSHKENTYIIDGKYTYIIPTNNKCGYKIIIDTEDIEKVKDYTWYISKDLYAKCNYKNKQSIQMHKIITNTNKEETVDHIKDLNNIPKTLNNTKENLRTVSKSQNNMNRKVASNNTSGIPGVSYSKQRSKWRSYIKINRKYINLGYYNDKNDAINARKEAEEKYFGEYSYSNSNKDFYNSKKPLDK